MNWLAPKKGAIFSLIYFFESFCLYYIPHNYVIPQAMPHAIPQTHSAFYRVITMGDVMDSTLMHINEGNAHGTQKERTKGAYLPT